MSKHLSTFRGQLSAEIQHVLYLLKAESSQLTAGFTMIETLVAISILTIAIVAPMTLTEQSLSSAYYARDQLVAFDLAQDALESVRQVRDNNILLTAEGTPTNMLTGLPSTSGQPFVIDTRNDWMQLCQGGVCPNIETDGTFYGYDQGLSGWTPTYFNRAVKVVFVKKTDGSTDNTDEIQVTAIVTWQSGGFQQRSITLSENLYQWVTSGSGAQ